MNRYRQQIIANFYLIIWFCFFDLLLHCNAVVLILKPLLIDYRGDQKVKTLPRAQTKRTEIFY